jgi:hypothetical protein
LVQISSSAFRKITSVMPVYLILLREGEVIASTVNGTSGIFEGLRHVSDHFESNLWDAFIVLVKLGGRLCKTDRYRYKGEGPESITCISAARHSSLKPDIMADAPSEQFPFVLLESHFVVIGLGLVFYGIVCSDVHWRIHMSP